VLQQWKLISTVMHALLGQQCELSVCVSRVMHDSVTQQWEQTDMISGVTSCLRRRSKTQLIAEASGVLFSALQGRQRTR
jgi:hypothetical protein